MRVETLHVCEGNSQKQNKTGNKTKQTPKNRTKTNNPQTKPAEFRTVLESETSET